MPTHSNASSAQANQLTSHLIQKIPEPIYVNIFKQQLLPLQRSIMVAEPEAIEEILNLASAQQFDDDDKVSVWLSIAYGHPTLSDAQLVQYMGILALPPDKRFFAIAILQKDSLLKGLNDKNFYRLFWSNFPRFYKNTHFSTSSIQTVFEAHFKIHDDFLLNWIFQGLSGAGQVAAIQYLLNFASAHAPNQVQAMLSYGRYQAFELAVQNDHLNLLKYLLQQVAPDKVHEIISADNYSAFRTAATC